MHYYALIEINLTNYSPWDIAAIIKQVASTDYFEIDIEDCQRKLNDLNKF